MAFLFVAFSFQIVLVETFKAQAPRVTLDVPLDLKQPVKLYDDFVRITEAPSHAEAEFYIILSYRTKEKRLLSLEIKSVGIENKQRTEFRYNGVVYHRTEVTQSQNIKVTLRDSLVYLEDKALNIISDLYTEQLHVTVVLLDVLDSGLDSKPILSGDFIQLPLIAPWSRPPKPGYSFPLLQEYLRDKRKRKIDKCANLNDIVDLLTFPVALTGKETGVKRILPLLAWPRKEFAEAHSTSKARFTISTWIFMLEPCLHGLCGILSHRSTVLLTPLLSVTSTGSLHVQVQYTEHYGHAFVVSRRLPLKKWVQIILTVNDTTFHVTIKHYNNHVMEKEENAVHNDFPQGSFNYKDTEGYWLLGATEGSPSFKGIIGHTRIYRRHQLFPNQVFMPPKHHMMFRIALGDHSVRCSEIIVNLHDAVLHEVDHAQKTNESCMETKRSLTDFLPTLDKSMPQCQVPLSRETPEVDVLVQKIFHLNHNNLEIVADSLFSTANAKLVESLSYACVVMSILRVSSCMGHGRSYYMAGVMNMIGLGVPQDKTQGWKYLLLGAANSDALSQMALAYRNFLGADGIPEDCDIAIGYYKSSALTADKLLQEHQEVATHSEAVRLDDYDELAKHRGNDSDVFQWLTHQALHGWTDAQSVLADMYYYGKRGIQRDLNRAVKYYQKGADSGDPEGLYNLGVSKLKGHGVEKNETEAIELFKLSAEKEFPPALNALGFYEGHMRRNHSGAVIYFRRAADLGDRDGLQNLAASYDNGWVEGHPPDKIAAFNYWFQAATKGHPGSCITVGEGASSGQHIEKNCPLGVVYLRYVAEQNPDVGWLLRRGLEAYYQGQVYDEYKSLVNFLLAGEVGMEVPLYNVAMLCEENEEQLTSVTAVDCTWHYYNRSAAMGWVFAMVKVGDNHWYGKTVPQNITMAAEMYTRAASKNGFPQALYNLAYMVEYGYSLKGTEWNYVDESEVLQGNFTFAASLYAKCRDSPENNNESFLPCAFGVVRVKLKLFWQRNTHLTQVSVVVLTTGVLGMMTYWVFYPDDNGL